jgi:hypothetical protein
MTQMVCEPLVGWRLWHVRAHDETYRLESFTWHHIAWPARERLAAQCAIHGDDAPVAAHECGIYAFTTRQLAEDLLRRYTGVPHRYGPQASEAPPRRRGRPIALGRVSLWGRVLARERGFRAQFAYPYDLVLIGGDAALARALRSQYAVDISAA